MNATKIIDVRNLNVHFTSIESSLHAVRGIDFYIRQGETVGIVGESGCGKSATAKAMLQLNSKYATKSSGEILYDGKNLLQPS